MAFCRNQSKGSCKRKETNEHNTAFNKTFLAGIFFFCWFLQRDLIYADDVFTEQINIRDVTINKANRIT